MRKCPILHSRDASTQHASEVIWICVPATDTAVVSAARLGMARDTGTSSSRSGATITTGAAMCSAECFDACKDLGLSAVGFVVVEFLATAATGVGELTAGALIDGANETNGFDGEEGEVAGAVEDEGPPFTAIASEVLEAVLSIVAKRALAVDTDARAKAEEGGTGELVAALAAYDWLLIIAR